MPLEQLRLLMEELVIESNLRDVGARVGLGHEALRKFIIGETEKPHMRTRRAMAELWLERRRLAVAEHDAVPSAGYLKLLLPRGLEKATAEVHRLFEAFRAGGRVPALAGDLENWLVRRLQEEYAREPAYPSRKKRDGGPPPEPA